MYLTVMCWCKGDGVGRPMKPVDDGTGHFKCPNCKIVVSATVFTDERVFETKKFNNKVMQVNE